MSAPTNSITFAANATVSSAFAIPGGLTLVGLIVPSTWTAQTLTIKVSVDGSTFYPIFTSRVALAGAAAYAFTSFAASQYLALSPDDFVGVSYIQLTSGAGQANAVTVTAVFREIR